MLIRYSKLQFCGFSVYSTDKNIGWSWSLLAASSMSKAIF